MQSMTGYGKASGALGEIDFDVQIKTVNGRFLDIQTRVPHRLLAMESALQETIRKRLLRGRVDVWINLRERTHTEININPTKVKSYIELVRQLGELGITGDLDVTGDIVYDEQTARNLNVTGIATINTLGVTGITTVGILTAYESITIGSTNVLTALSGKTSIGLAIALG